MPTRTSSVRDILRFGAEVEVIAPPKLRDAVVQRLARALQRYG